MSQRDYEAVSPIDSFRGATPPEPKMFRWFAQDVRIYVPAVEENDAQRGVMVVLPAYGAGGHRVLMVGPPTDQTADMILLLNTVDALQIMLWDAEEKHRQLQHQINDLHVDVQAWRKKFEEKQNEKWDAERRADDLRGELAKKTNVLSDALRDLRAAERRVRRLENPKAKRR